MTARRAASHKDMGGLKVLNLGAPAPGSADAARQTDVEDAADYAVSRANHVGTQLAGTISDLDVAVRANRLDQFAAPAGPVALADQRLTGLGAPTGATDAATRGYVDTTLAGLATGQVMKGDVRAVADEDVDLGAAPATIDGITPAPGDVFLLAGQDDAAENGPYVWTAAGAAMARADNWDTDADADVGSYWIVREGTRGDRFALLTNDAFTLGTTGAAFAFVGVAESAAAAFEQDLGDGATTTHVLAHGLGTRAVHVAVWRNASPYDEVDVAVERTDPNTITLRPDAVWGAGEFRAAVARM